MAILELIPLTTEAISKMDLTKQDLWQVRIHEELFGPFEVESLKSYIKEHQGLFKDAWATNLAQEDWKPILEHAAFKSLSPKFAKDAPEGQYWLLDNGQKTGPFPKTEIEKKITAGELYLTSLLSVDDGHTWQKLFEHENFNIKFHASSDLPDAPGESSFHKVKLELLDKIESTGQAPSVNDKLAEAAHLFLRQKKAVDVKLDEIPLKPSEMPMSSAMKWAIPAFALFFVSVFVGYRVWTSRSEEPVVVAEETEKETKTQKVIKKVLPAHRKAPPVVALPQVAPPPSPRVMEAPERELPPPRRPSESYQRPVVRRAPVRVRPEPHNPQNQDSRYPTHMETHENDRFPANEPDPMVDPVAESEEVPQPGQEPSLVGGGGRPEDHVQDPGIPKDNAQEGEVSPEAVVEEVSDF